MIDEPCDCGGKGLGLNGFHYRGAIGCKWTSSVGVTSGSGSTRREAQLADALEEAIELLGAKMEYAEDVAAIMRLRLILQLADET